MRALLAELLGRITVSAMPAGTLPKKSLGVQVLRASKVTYMHDQLMHPGWLDRMVAK